MQEIPFQRTLILKILQGRMPLDPPLGLQVTAFGGLYFKPPSLKSWVSPSMMSEKDWSASRFRFQIFIISHYLQTYFTITHYLQKIN